MEGSGAIYERLLDRLREELPTLAQQVDEEVRRGRRAPTDTLSEPDRHMREIKMREAGTRISNEDIASVQYSDDERLALLIEALLHLGSSMATSREAVAKALYENDLPPTIRFRTEEELEAEVEIDVGREATTARDSFDEIVEPLRRALEDLT